MKRIVSPRELAEAIGVSESSVKRWVDGGAIQASRTAGGHRRIAAGEAIRFIRESGSTLLDPEKLGLEDVASLRGSEPPKGEEAEALFVFLREGLTDRAGGLLVSLFLGGRSVAQIVDGPLRQSMARLGELWTHGRSGIFVEHRATSIAIHGLSRLRSLLTVADDAPCALGGAPSGDRHILPSLAVAAVLEEEGLRAINLGPETPLDIVRLAADEMRPDLVWLSASAVPEPAELSRGVEGLVEHLSERSVPLVIGGREADRLEIGRSPFLYHGASMAELGALVRGFRLAHRAASA